MTDKSIVDWIINKISPVRYAVQYLTYLEKMQVKTNLDLNNVNNTSDANKPISTATQTALDLKYAKAGDTLTGTAGNGYYGGLKQSAKPSTPADGIRWYVDASGRFSWIGESGYVRTFDGTANTADRVYVLPDTAGTIALTGESYPRYSWAEKPAANSVSSGYRITITDWNADFESNGTMWLAVGGSFLFYKRHSSATVGAVTTEAVLDTITVPGGLLGPNGRVEIDSAWVFAGSGGNRTPRIRWGSVSSTAYFGVTVASSYSGYTSRTIVINANSASSQSGIAAASFGSGATTAGEQTSSVDTSSDWNIYVTGQKANSADTFTSRFTIIRVHTGA